MTSSVIIAANSTPIANRSIRWPRTMVRIGAPPPGGMRAHCARRLRRPILSTSCSSPDGGIDTLRAVRAASSSAGLKSSTPNGLIHRRRRGARTASPLPLRSVALVLAGRQQLGLAIARHEIEQVAARLRALALDLEPQVRHHVAKLRRPFSCIRAVSANSEFRTPAVADGIRRTRTPWLGPTMASSVKTRRRPPRRRTVRLADERNWRSLSG